MPRRLPRSATAPSARIVTLPVLGTDVRLPVCAEVAPLLIGLAAEFHRTAEPLRAGTCQGIG